MPSERVEKAIEAFEIAVFNEGFERGNDNAAGIEISVRKAARAALVAAIEAEVDARDARIAALVQNCNLLAACHEHAGEECDRLTAALAQAEREHAILTADMAEQATSHQALIVRCVAAEAALEAALKPVYFWDADDWEFTTEDVTHLTDHLPIGDVIRIGRAAALPDQWAVRLLIGDEDDSEEELRFFDTEEQAHAALAAPAAETERMK